MDYRTPLQHLLRTLLPTRQQTPASEAETQFADTRPSADAADAEPAPPRRESRRAVAERKPAAKRGATSGWGESSIELAQGTEIMEFPEDTAADLMDEYFAELSKRAA